MPQCQGMHGVTTEGKRERARYIYWSDRSCDHSRDYSSRVMDTANTPPSGQREGNRNVNNNKKRDLRGDKT